MGLEGPPSSKLFFNFYRHGGGGGGGIHICNEGPQIILAQGLIWPSMCVYFVFLY